MCGLQEMIVWYSHGDTTDTSDSPSSYTSNSYPSVRINFVPERPLRDIFTIRKMTPLRESDFLKGKYDSLKEVAKSLNQV